LTDPEFLTHEQIIEAEEKIMNVNIANRGWIHFMEKKRDSIQNKT